MFEVPDFISRAEAGRQRGDWPGTQPGRPDDGTGEGGSMVGREELRNNYIFLFPFISCHH